MLTLQSCKSQDVYFESTAHFKVQFPRDVDDHRHEAKINFGRVAVRLRGLEASLTCRLFRQAP